MNTLRNNISQFQNGGMKGKGVVDNLFIIRGVIDHALYLGKELCITFFDIEKCFDSLWLEDCINSFHGPKSLKSITTIPSTPLFEVEYHLKEWSNWNSGNKFQ